jgi:hypothetical protein
MPAPNLIRPAWHQGEPWARVALLRVRVTWWILALLLERALGIH